ncbi:MAG: hypothetical protein AB7N24_14555 [Dehalococcoidia bacterium]
MKQEDARQESPQELARRALQQALESGSQQPLAEAAELLIEAVLNDPSLMDVLQAAGNDELDVIAKLFPGGSAGRLRDLGLAADE